MTIKIVYLHDNFKRIEVNINLLKLKKFLSMYLYAFICDDSVKFILNDSDYFLIFFFFIR